MANVWIGLMGAAAVAGAGLIVLRLTVRNSRRPAAEPQPAPPMPVVNGPPPVATPEQTDESPGQADRGVDAEPQMLPDTQNNSSEQRRTHRVLLGVVVFTCWAGPPAAPPGSPAATPPAAAGSQTLVKWGRCHWSSVKVV